MKKVLTGTQWNNYTLDEIDKQNQTYKLVLSGDTKNPIYITPVVYGKDYKEAMMTYSENLKKFNEQVKIISDKVQHQEQVDRFVREVQVSSMGIYNWDRIKGKKGW